MSECICHHGIRVTCPIHGEQYGTFLAETEQRHRAAYEPVDALTAEQSVNAKLVSRIASLRQHLSESRAECVVIAAKLASVTAARDEACDWAEGVGDKHRPYGLRVADQERIADLRKAGMA